MQNRRSIAVLLFILVLDLMGFTLIFPLVPDLLSYYVHTTSLHSMDSYLPQFIDFLLIIAPTIGSGEEREIIILGGVLGSSYALLQFLFAPFWGRLSDRIGRRPVLLITSIGLGAAYLFWAFSTSFTFFLLSRIIAGIMAGNLGIATAAMADTSSKEGRTKSMGLVGAAFGVGFIIGPAIGGALSTIDLSSLSNLSIPHHPFSAAAFVSVGLSILSAVLNYFFLIETLPKEKRSQDKLRFQMPFKVFTELKDAQFRRMLVLNFGFMFLFTAFEFTVTFFYKIDFGLPPSKIGLIFLYLGLLLAFGQGFLVRRLSKSMSEMSMIIVGFISLAIGLTFLAFSAPNVMDSLFALAPIALGSSLLQPSMAGLASRSISAEKQGLAMSSFRSMGSLARGVGPIFGSYIYSLLGIKITYISIAVLIVFLFGFAYVFSKFKPVSVEAL